MDQFFIKGERGIQAEGTDGQRHGGRVKFWGIQNVSVLSGLFGILGRDMAWSVTMGQEGTR